MSSGVLCRSIASLIGLEKLRFGKSHKYISEVLDHNINKPIYNHKKYELHPYIQVTRVISVSFILVIA